jgi:hypothetical protein
MDSDLMADGGGWGGGEKNTMPIGMRKAMRLVVVLVR